MHKAIGFIACVSVMAASLYLFSGGDPSRTLSAQTESAGADDFGSVARRFMNDARQLASQGNTEEARRLAETAASFSTDWQEGEQTPEQFLKSLDRPAIEAGDTWSLADAADWSALEPEKIPEPRTVDPTNPFQQAAAASQAKPEPKAGGAVAILKKKQAAQLLREARQALKDGNTAVARTRAMQARQLNVAWGVWDERPEHVLAEIDQTEGVETFLADAPKPVAPTAQPAVPQNSQQNLQQATALIQQARSAMDQGQLQKAQQLAEQAASLNVAFGLFEDKPELVLRDINRLAQTESAPAIDFGSNQSPAVASPAASQAKELISQARTALAQGRLEAARTLATQAQDMNVAYSLLDDRPELVLNEVNRTLNGRGQQCWFNAEHCSGIVCR